MIHVPRGTCPVHLDPISVKGLTERLCWRRREYYIQYSQYKNGAIQNEPARPKASRERYAHTDVLDALELMFAMKCAYCETWITARSWRHVEHFRPNSIYPALAYDWNNLLQACGGCNCAPYKADEFPIGPAGNTPRENKFLPCNRKGIGEQPYLLDPCVDDPSQHLTFRNGRAFYLTSRGRRTRKVCGLNRQELLEDRQSYLTLILIGAEEYLNSLDSNNVTAQRKYAALLRDACTNEAQYTGMVRAELQSMGIDWQAL